MIKSIKEEISEEVELALLEDIDSWFVKRDNIVNAIETIFDRVMNEKHDIIQNYSKINKNLKNVIDTVNNENKILSEQNEVMRRKLSVESDGNFVYEYVFWVNVVNDRTYREIFKNIIVTVESTDKIESIKSFDAFVEKIQKFVIEMAKNPEKYKDCKWVKHLNSAIELDDSLELENISINLTGYKYLGCVLKKGE